VGPEDTLNAGVFGEHGAVADARDATLACVVAKEDVAQADYSSWLRGMRRLTAGRAAYQVWKCVHAVCSSGHKRFVGQADADACDHYHGSHITEYLQHVD
jgi:hypothetical protein